MCLNFSHEYVGKGDSHFRPHRSAVYLKIVLSIKLEGIFFKYETKHFSEVVCGYGRAIIVKGVVRFAYCFDTLFLWYICIQARYVKENTTLHDIFKFEEFFIIQF